MANFKIGFIDMHSHLLPIQDGPKDIHHALKAIQIAEKNNIAAMVFTPHFYACDVTYNEEYVLEVFKNLKKELFVNNLNMNIYLGNECIIDDKMINAVKSGREITMNQTKYILCEYPFYQLPFDYHSLIYQLIDEGYLPIIAHPERNNDIGLNYKGIIELKNNGCLIQVNAGSILEKNGRESRKYALRMLNESLADFVASDAHSSNGRSPDILSKAYKKVEKIVDKEYLEDLFFNNPLKIINLY